MRPDQQPEAQADPDPGHAVVRGGQLAPVRELDAGGGVRPSTCGDGGFRGGPGPDGDVACLSGLRGLDIRRGAEDLAQFGGRQVNRPVRVSGMVWQSSHGNIVLVRVRVPGRICAWRDP